MKKLTEEVKVFQEDGKWIAIYRGFSGIGQTKEDAYKELCTALLLWSETIEAERTHPAPEVREALEFYRDGFEPYKEIPSIPGFAWKPTEELLNDCGERAKAALSLPGLEAVKCELCRGYGTVGPFTAPCPQRCDKGRVWVRKEKV